MNKHAIGHDSGRSAAAFTVAEFCDTHRVSRTHLYKLWGDGRGPRRMRLGKLILITAEAAVDAPRAPRSSASSRSGPRTDVANGRAGQRCEGVSTKRPPAKDLPPDVIAGQVWREGDQHYRVESVYNDQATLQRCTPAGTVLNARFRTTRSGDQMRASFVLVKSV